MTPFERHKHRHTFDMTGNAEVVLDIARKHPNNRIMEIVSIGVNSGLATTATVHKELMWLNKKGYVKVVDEDGDKRSKIVKLTIKGKNFLEKL